jgi:hypothetical protein
MSLTTGQMLNRTSLPGPITGFAAAGESQVIVGDAAGNLTNLVTGAVLKNVGGPVTLVAPSTMCGIFFASHGDEFQAITSGEQC